ncbi:hypothetical protein CSKR_100692 [Clonorchis sinensis]|uniref:Uncharacterized protein n=1 Tax=Clonorchis sinensis TaxID=79923 RepID=A0A419PKX0_CLOSI|nr:hypothetical protein CSKR_100692 [Clonorchis sinensis]
MYIYSNNFFSVVRIDGPVYLSGVEASNPAASKARSAVVQQILNVAEKSQNKVPVPQNIEFVSSYEASTKKAIYDLYFYPASDYRISARVQKDKKWLVWESIPSESSEEYQKIKDGVIEDMRRHIEKTPFARSMITLKVEKILPNYVHEVFVELRMTFDLIGTIQTIGYSALGQLAREPKMAISSALKSFTWDEAGVVQIILDGEHAEIRSTRIVCGDVFKPFAGILVEPKPHSMEEHMEHHMAGQGHGTGDNGKHGEAYMQWNVPKAKEDESDGSAATTPLSILILVTLLLTQI